MEGIQQHFWFVLLEGYTSALGSRNGNALFGCKDFIIMFRPQGYKVMRCLYFLVNQCGPLRHAVHPLLITTSLWQ